jgi:large subunit ribosomal protein L18
MNPRKTLNKIRDRRKRRTRSKIHGTADRPRFSVFRSNRYTYAQLIDDEKRKTLIGASSRDLEKKRREEGGGKINLSEQLGELVAKKALERGIKKAVFDRGKYKYHGRVKSVAEGAKKGGLQM